ncbi:MAG: alpha/beta fold hydrolase [Veillonella caviae]|nr:alpha/beta fold hydrolase [Veillonella caviae]
MHRQFQKYRLIVGILGVLLVWPITSQGRTEALSIAGDHGKLAAIMQVPDEGTNYPMAIIMHGFSSSKDAKLLQLIAEDLEQAGIASIRFDFNGHGESDGRFQDMTVLNEIADAKAVYSYLKDEASNRTAISSISLVGHSQGGVIASMLAGELAKEEGQDSIKSVVLLAPAGNIQDGLIGGSFFGIQYNVEELPEVVELPSGLKVGRNYFKTAYDSPIYETAKQYTGPVDIIQGSDDMVAPARYVQRFDKEYARSEIHMLQGYDHEFTQNQSLVASMVKDFIVNKTSDSAPVDDADLPWWDKIIHWLKSIVEYFI